MIVAAAELMILLSVFAAVFGATGYLVSRSSREWGASWRGHRIHIVMNWKKCRLMVDDELVGEWGGMFGFGFGKRCFETQYEMANGVLDLQLVFKVDSNGSIAGAQLVIDGELVPLAAAPRDMFGKAISEKLPKLKSIDSVQGTPIRDPRYSAAVRLFESIQAELSDDDPSQPLMRELQTELQEHILIAQRLGLSREDYASLGNDGGQLDLAQAETEERIQLLLSGLQDIHLAVVQRNIASSEPLIDRVQQLLFKLHADVEVESTDSDLKKNRHRNAAQDQKTP